MTRRPWFPFWTSFYDSADDLTGKQQAIIIALMSIAWRQPDAALPDDMTWIRNRVKAHMADAVSMQDVSYTLARFFMWGTQDSRWHHRDLDNAKTSYENIKKGQAKRAAKRW